MRRLFVARSVDDFLDGATPLKRSLGARDLVLLGIGGVIGAGIFVLTGVAAAQYAGPSITLSFILAAIACGLAGFCYSELASMIPVSGSAYSYAYATMGQLIAWIIGWDLVLEYAVAAATVAIGWAGYFTSFLDGVGLGLPPTLTAAPAVHPGAIANFPAAVIVLLLTGLLSIGIRESISFNNLIVLVKVAVIVLFIAAGIGQVQPSLWVPYFPFGFPGMVTGAGVIFFAYIGFDAVSTAAQEAVRPERDVPTGIIGSLAICTLLYILVAMVLTGIVSYTELNVAAPMAVAVDRVGLHWLSPLIKVGAIAGLTSVILVLLMGQSRIFYAMSRDRLLPPIMAYIHPRFKTPFLSTWLVGCAVALVAAFTPIGKVGELVSIGTLFAFAIVCAGVIVLRYRRPDLPRIFRCPAVPWVPLGGIIVSVYLMLGLPYDTWIRLIVWFTLGMVIYLGYGIRKANPVTTIAPTSPHDKP